MKIYFSTTFDGRVLSPETNERNFESLYLGPIGLISFFQQELGLTRPQIENNLRLFNYKNALSKNIDEFPNFKESFDLDPLVFSEKILPIRDWLEVNGILHKEWNDVPRFKLIKKVEENFETKGWSSDFVEVKERLKVKDVEHHIIILQSEETLPYNWKEFFKEIINKVEYRPSSIKFEDNSLKEFLNWIKQPISSEKKELSTDESLEFLEVEEWNEIAPFIAKITQDKENLLITDTNNSGLSGILKVQSGNQLDFTSDVTGSFWQVLPNLLLNLVSTNLDVSKLYDLTSSRYSPFKFSYLEIQSKLNYEVALDYESWISKWNDNDKIPKNLVDNYSDEVLEFLHKRELLFNSENEADLYNVIQFLNKWLTWYSSQKKWWDAYNKVEVGALKGDAKKGYDTFILTLNQLIFYLENLDTTSISFNSLNNLIDRLKTPFKVGVSSQEKDSSWLLDSPGLLVTGKDISIKNVYWIINNDFNIGQDNLDWMLVSERNAAEKYFDISKTALLPMAEVLTRAFQNGINLKVVFVKRNLTEENGVPLIVNFLRRAVELGIKKSNSTIELLGEIKSVSSTSFLSPIKKQKYWNFPKSSMRDLSFKEVESFSSVNELLHYPHAYFLKNILNTSPRKQPGFYDVFAAKGKLAHAVIESFVNEEKWNISGKEIEDKCNEIVEKVAPILLFQRYQMELKQVIFSCKKSVPNLFKQIIALNLPNLKVIAEEKRESKAGVLSSVPVKGYLDLVIYDGKIPKAVIDLKFTGFNSRKEAISTSSDYQLAVYSRLLNDDNIARAYFIIKENVLMSENNFLFKKALEVNKLENRDITIAEQIREFDSAYSERKKDILNGIVEVGIEESLEDLEFFSERHFKENPSWKKTKEANRYESYENLLG